VAFYTDKAIEKAMPGTIGLPLEELEQLAQDANLIYGYVHHQPGCTEAQLRNWAEGKDIGPDRVTSALGLLRATHRLFQLSDEAKPIAEGQPDTSPQKASRRTSRKS
jgi:hypothetical protein